MQTLGLRELNPFRACKVDARHVGAHSRRIPSDRRNLYWTPMTRSRSASPPATVLLHNDESPAEVKLNLRTLNRYKVTQEDYVDLSNRSCVVLDQSHGDKQSEQMGQPTQETSLDSLPERPVHATISYAERKLVLPHRTRKFERVPFPANTRGFFYYLPSPQHPASGQIRFRLESEGNPMAGTNLLDEYGLPWSIPLLAIAHSKRLKPLSDVMQRDKSLARPLLDMCEALQETIGGSKLGQFSQLVASLRQPFHVDLSKPDAYIFVLGWKSLYMLHNRFMFSPVGHLEPSYWPYEGGILRCHMVPLYVDKTEGRPNEVGVRVVRIIEPVRKKKDIPHGTLVADDVQPMDLVRLGGKPLPVCWRFKPNVRDALLTRNKMRKWANMQALAWK
ncbi:hypothetical protein GY45DRAFT_112890 [Cubamyces sp. BRFM 1775]|nr:hypothetical protein GY45DRAFT_112890 [Cubamyces sp. BRFM 1775]